MKHGIRLKNASGSISFFLMRLLRLLGGNKDGHFGFDTDIGFLEKLKELSLVDERTIVCVNHFSHNGGAIHDDMVEAMKKYNILVFYDGMEVVF